MKLIADASRIQKCLETIAHMPNRFTGTEGEKRAANWIESHFTELGLTNVHQHIFGFPNWLPRRYGLRIGKTIPNRKVVCGTVVYSASTGPHGVCGEIIYLQTGSALDFEVAGNLQGKIGLIFGLSFQDEDIKHRIRKSKMIGLIAVDMRFPTHKETSNGLSPQWTGGFHLPCLSMPLFGAMEVVKQLPLRARLVIESDSRMDLSENVIGEIPGTSNRNEVLLVSAHHDAVWGVPGVDDNGSGVVALLELATLLHKCRMRRTIRFISFGTEERLSVGSYMYMRTLGSAAKSIRWCLNFDSFASRVGEDTIWTTGTPAMHRFVQRQYTRARHPVKLIDAANIYSDHFPLNAVGVPSIFITRPSLPGQGHWNLHTTDDSLENVSAPVAGRTITTAANMLIAVDREDMPFRRAISSGLMGEVRRAIREAYRHPVPLVQRSGVQWMGLPRV